MSSALCCLSTASLCGDSSGQFAALVLDFQADLANSWSVAGTGSVGITVTPQLHFTLDGRKEGREEGEGREREELIRGPLRAEAMPGCPPHPPFSSSSLHHCFFFTQAHVICSHENVWDLRCKTPLASNTVSGFDGGEFSRPGGESEAS